MNNLVEVLLPTHNAPERLETILACLQRQTTKNFVLRIGDNSERNPRIQQIISLFRKDLKIEHVQHKKNLGPFKNHNFLLRSVASKYFCLINTDDTINDTFVEAHLDNLEMTSCAVSVSNVKQYRDGEFFRTNYKPNTNGPTSSFCYCLRKYRDFAPLESIYYGMVRNAAGLKFSITDRLGTANGLVFKYSLLGSMKTAENAVYTKYGTTKDFEKYRELRRIKLLSSLAQTTRMPEIYPYFFLNALQALCWRITSII